MSNSLNRRKRLDRRINIDRRDQMLLQQATFHQLTWRDQQLQYLLRYIILALGFLYFNMWGEHDTLWMSLSQINLYFFIHGIFISLLYWHATKQRISILRFRSAMFLDVVSVSIATVNDPALLPPCLLVYMLIVLGNGMRYGMRMFRESLALTLTAIMIVMSFRYILTEGGYSIDLVFMNIFGLIILIYAYVLAGRLESTRLRLEKLSQRDELTGLLNRRALYKKTAKLVHFRAKQLKKRELIVMFADLDKFKLINDKYGHSAGDLVIKNVANIIKSSLRDVDVIARFGGDEFVIILPETSITVVESIAVRIQDRVQNWAKNNAFDFNISLGVGAVPHHGNDLDEVIKTVDNAMYYGKEKNGPGGLCYAMR